MVENDKSTECTKFGKIDQNDDYVNMWCGRRYLCKWVQLQEKVNMQSLYRPPDFILFYFLNSILFYFIYFHFFIFILF